MARLRVRLAVAMGVSGSDPIGWTSFGAGNVNDRGFAMETDARKTGSGGNWWYIGWQGKQKEIPGNMNPTSHPPNELAGHLDNPIHGRAVLSSARLLQYFGFREEPFGVSPDPRCLYLSRAHREALESLESGFYSNRGFIALIAPPGMGKTTLLFRFLEDTRETARSVFLFDIDAGCEPRDFVAYILRDIGITPGRTNSEMHEQLSGALVKETQAGRKFVIVIDEAQNLSDAVLERVRLLTNFETSRGKLIQTILSGQTQLSDKLLKASLVQLRQRISAICRIEPLPAEETAPYIDYRVKLAGYDGEPLFTEDALKLITEASHGTPRTINNLCFNALSLCYALKSKQVDGSMMAKAIAGLHLIPHSREPIETAGNVAAAQPHQPLWKRATESLRLWVAPKWSQASGSPKFWIPAAAVLLVVCVVGLLRLTELRAPQSRKTSDDRSLNREAAPRPVPAPATANTSKAMATEPTPNSQPLEPGYGVGHPVSAPTMAATVQAAAPAQKPVKANSSIPQPSAATVRPAAPAQKPVQANGSIPEPSAATVRPAAPAQRPAQANGSIPEPSAVTVRPAAPAQKPAQANSSIPEPSAATVQAAAPAQKPAQANGSIPEPSAATVQATQAPVMPLRASAAAQPPSPGAGANPVNPKQSPAPAGKSGSPAGALPGAEAAQVHVALKINPPQALLPVAASNVPPDVHPALSAGFPLMVQIAATAHPEDADALVSALRKRGYPVTARREPADNLIHVRIGPLYSRDEANQWRVKLLHDGYNAIIQP